MDRQTRDSIRRGLLSFLGVALLAAPAAATIQWEKATACVNESAGRLDIELTRTGPDRSTPAQYYAIALAGSAKGSFTTPCSAGVDFSQRWTSIYTPFPACPVDEAAPCTTTLTLDICQDGIAEPDETFTVVVTAETLSHTEITGSPDTMTITISDSCPLAYCGGTNATTLALNDDRFQIGVNWRDFQGNTGVGYAEKLTADTGYFWFFDHDNVEIMVKALDARSIGSGFWIFAGALSNVEYTMTVRDIVTGQTRVYSNPSGIFASFGDTAAFAGVAAPGSCPPFTPPILPAGCDPPPDGMKLCLTQGERFQVTVDWRDFQGNSGQGRAVTLTRDGGYFWFFTANNVELIVKVLDARVINGKFWVFYGALSNVEYTIRVRDTQTGQERVYANPLGQFASAGDTSAF